MSYPELIETEGLTLRRPTEADADAYTAIWSDPTVWEALRVCEDPDPAKAAAESLAKQLHHWDEHGFGLWGAIPAGEGAPVGWVGAWYPNFMPAVLGETEIGWTLRAPFRGRGHATQGAGLAIACAFEHHAPDRVVSLISPGNAASAAVANRLGMREAGEGTTDLGMTLRIFELPRTG